jgi:hypothetical protein
MNSSKSILIYTLFILGLVIVIDTFMKSRKTASATPVSINQLPDKGEAVPVVESQKLASKPAQEVVEEKSDFFATISDSFGPVIDTKQKVGMEKSDYFVTIDNPLKVDTAPYQFYEEPMENKFQKVPLQVQPAGAVALKAPETGETTVQPFNSDGDFAFV